MPGSPSIAKPPPDFAGAARPERREGAAAGVAETGPRRNAEPRPAGGWPIAILSFDRPDYLRRVLDSLKSQIGCDLECRSVTLFQDGAVNPHSSIQRGAIEDIAQCVDLFKQRFPRGEVVPSSVNLGAALNFDRAETMMFETLGAEAAIFLEDDLVLGPNYISTLEALISIFIDDDRVGYVAAYGDHRKTIEEQRANCDRLVLLGNNWGFALFRWQWLRMRARIREYLQLMENTDYYLRDGDRIARLFAAWGYGCPATSQDAAKTIACCADGVIKLNTYVCNAAYIGEHGIHMRPQLFAARGYGNTAIYPEKIDRFRPLDEALYSTLLRQQRNWADRPDAAGTNVGASGGPASAPRRRAPVDLADDPAASALLASAGAALEGGEPDLAMASLLQGAETFAHVVDGNGDPVFAKEAFQLSLSRNDLRSVQRIRRQVRERHGPFHWGDILFARHLTAAGDREEAVKWWDSVLAHTPSQKARDEALAAIARLELGGRADSRLQKYLFDGGYNAVRGPCEGSTLYRITQFHELQVAHGIIGDLFEIGVYHGRLFILLALLARPEEERAIAIDVFEVGPNYDPGGGSTTLATLERNYASFVGDPAGLCCIASDSLLLTPDAIRDKSAVGQVRMASIDGAHSHQHTTHDLWLAESVLAPGGIVLVDDITNPGWPGVMEGVARYLLGSERRLFPFMMSSNKLWLTTRDHHQIYLDFARDKVRLTRAGRRKRITEFFGCNLVGW
jgi:hypothetical protein